MTFIVSSLALSAVMQTLAHADEPSPRERFQQEAQSYEMRLGDQQASQLELTSKPVLHWGNPAANGEDGAVFVWLHQGRPEVIGTFFTYRRASTGEIVLKHSLHSLTSHSITAAFQGQRVWSPRLPGVDFRPVPEAPPPAETARLRLLQMKSLAKEFSGKLVDLKGQSFALRLLPQPLVRYEPTETKVLDGAIFALAEGTDPQSLVLIEARNSAAAPRWEYAFARFHFASLWGYHRDSEVWRVDADPSQTRSALGAGTDRQGLYLAAKEVRMRALRLLPQALVACAMLTLNARAQERFEGLDGYIREAMGQWQVPGLVIAVVKDGDIVLARGYGHRQLGQDSPVTTDTVFSIASCTKSFTAGCIAMLVDEGKLHWDDPVRKHLPDFKVADAYVTEQITLRDLLCHRTGLVRGDLLGMTGSFTHAEMLNQIQLLQQTAPFRAKVTYHNLMFAVLGEIIQKKSGANWQDFVATRMFEPLEMKSTTADRGSVPPDRLATRHRFYDGELATLRTPISNLMAPAGAIHSTVNDMARWLSFHLREGERGGRRLVSTTAMREMHSLQQSIPVKWRPDSRVYDARFVGTGLGWYVRDYRGRKVVQHGGAWGAEPAFVPEENLAVVVLSNRDWNSLVWMLIYDVIDAYVVGPEQAWSKGKKWDFWLRLGGPEAMGRDLKAQRAELEKNRKTATHLSLPLTQYAGTYRSRLYGDLTLKVVGDRLRVQFGDYAATLDHWEQDTFYGRAVIEPFFDWLVKFDLDQQSIKGLEIIHVGWKDPDERFVFTRVDE